MNTSDFERLCGQPFNENVKAVVVYTGENVDSIPQFRKVFPIAPCRVLYGSSRIELWGIVALDAVSKTSEWHNYNNCVSLENFAVLRRFLDNRFAWMSRVPGLRDEIMNNVKNMLS